MRRRRASRPGSPACSWSAAPSSTARSTPTALPISEDAACRPVSPYGDEQGRGRGGRARSAPRARARASSARARSTTPDRASRPRSSCPAWPARIAAAERDGRATRSSSATAIPCATSATCATSCARTRCSPSAVWPARPTTCARAAACASATSPTALVARADAARCASSPPPTSCARSTCPRSSAIPTKLVAATGWQPEHDARRHPRRRARRRARRDAARVGDRRLGGHVGVRAPLGTWRASQPSSVAIARGSWRSRCPAPCTNRISEFGRPASASARASSTGTSASSTPCSTSSGRRSSRAAAAMASTRPMSRTQRVRVGREAVAADHAHRARVREQPAGSCAQSRSVLGDAIVATPRTRWSSAASHTANVPPWPKPATHTPRTSGARVQRAHRVAQVVEPSARREVALGRAGAAEVEREHRPTRLRWRCGRRGRDTWCRPSPHPAAGSGARGTAPARGSAPAGCGTATWAERRGLRTGWCRPWPAYCGHMDTGRARNGPSSCTRCSRASRSSTCARAACARTVGTSRVQSTRFWLYPTAEHQKPELLKEPYRHWIDLAHAAPVGEPITIEGWADVVKRRDRSPSAEELDAIASKLDLDRRLRRVTARAGRSVTRCGCWRSGCTGCSTRSRCRGATPTAAARRGSSSPASPTIPRRSRASRRSPTWRSRRGLKGARRRAPVARRPAA